MYLTLHEGGVQRCPNCSDGLQVLASRAGGVRGLSRPRLAHADLRHLQQSHAETHPVAADLRRAAHRGHGRVLHHVSGTLIVFP